MLSTIDFFVSEIENFFKCEDNEVEQYDVLEALVRIYNDVVTEYQDAIYCLCDNKSLAAALLNTDVNYMDIHHLCELTMKGNGSYFSANDLSKVMSKPEVLEIVFPKLRRIVANVIYKPFEGDRKYIYETFIASCFHKYIRKD